jgi:predicted nucleic acid-binding protein
MGLTVIDAGVFIGFNNREDPHHMQSHRALVDARDRRDRVCIPVSALAESLVSPARAGDQAVEDVWDTLDRIPIDVIPLDAEVAMATADLRARHRGLKLPDAMVVATAAVSDADHLVTTDRGWPSRKTLGLRAQIHQL